MSELDLQRALAGAGAGAEDFQDQAGAIEHLGVPRLLEIALLHRRERAIDYDQARLHALDKAGDLRDLAGADERRRPDRGDRHDAGLENIEIDRARETDRLVELGGGRARACRHRRSPARRPTAQLGLDDDGAPDTRARWRAQLVCARDPTGFSQALSPVGRSSVPSNSWIGCPGMIVEMACL